MQAYKPQDHSASPDSHTMLNVLCHMHSEVEDTHFILVKQTYMIHTGHSVCISLPESPYFILGFNLFYIAFGK